VTGPNGAFIRTFSGREFNPLEIAYENIVIEDIAHALALCNRFAGHTKFPISVAQHSIYVCRLCEDRGPIVALQGLLHDASEAYLGDVTKWVKQTPAFALYREIEETVQRKIFERFDVPVKLFPEVEEADRIMVRFEGVKGFGKEFKIDHPNYPDLTEEEKDRVGGLSPWSWRSSEDLFLTHFRIHINDRTINEERIKGL
jgi:hypothetical protein